MGGRRDPRGGRVLERQARCDLSRPAGLGANGQIVGRGATCLQRRCSPWGQRGHACAPERAEPYAFPGEADIPAWDWLYGRHLLRGEVSGSAAMGGTGKSTLSIVEALAMASGRPLLGAPGPKPLRVVLVNLEDSRNTMDKRIAAVMRLYGLTPADIGDRLILKAKGEIKMKVAQLLALRRRGAQ